MYNYKTIGGGMEHRPACKCSEASSIFLATSPYVAHLEDLGHLLQKQNFVSTKPFMNIDT